MYLDLGGYWTSGSSDASFPINNQFDSQLSTMACTTDVAIDGAFGNAAYFWYKLGPNTPLDGKGEVFPAGPVSVYVSNSDGSGTSTAQDLVPFVAFVGVGAGVYTNVVEYCSFMPSDVALNSAAAGQEYLLHCPASPTNNVITIASATAGRRLCIGDVKICANHPPSPPVPPPSSPPASTPALPPSAPSPIAPPPASPPPITFTGAVWAVTGSSGTVQVDQTSTYVGDYFAQSDSGTVGPFYTPWFVQTSGALAGTAAAGVNPTWTESNTGAAVTNAVMKIDWLAGGDTIAVGNGVVTTQKQWNTAHGGDKKEAALVYNDLTCLYPVLTAKQGTGTCSSFGDGQACTVLNSDRRVARYQFEIGTGAPPSITGVAADAIFVSVHDVATRQRGDGNGFDKRYVIAPGASSVHADSSKILTGSTGGGAPYWAEPASDDDP
eukprot:1027558-Prymnesium_polylepis.1